LTGNFATDAERLRDACAALDAALAAFAGVIEDRD
jgi:hypothetical protein